MGPGLRRQWERIRVARADLLRARSAAESTRDAAEVAVVVADCRAQLAALGVAVDGLAERAAADRERLLHAVRVARDDDVRARERLLALRTTPEYERAFTDPEPLVTILITTYRNWPMLRERSLPSVLAQSYEHIEVIVVGDAAPPEAAEVVTAFGDPRARFVNLPYRGPYPTDRRQGWLVSGTTPWNTGFSLARGAWVGSNSDDDALRPDYVETLLGLAREQHAEVPYGLIAQRRPNESDLMLGAFPPRLHSWGTQGSLIHAGLGFMPLQPTDWLFDVPNDWSLAERMLRIGVRFALTESPVVDYYPSQLWSEDRDRAEF